MTADPVRRHDSWLKVAGWTDSTDHQTGHRRSDIGQIADFSGQIREETRGSFRRPQRVFTWRICRQRTEREGPDGRGQHWSGDLAEGEAPTLAKAKSAATTALRQHRTDHILAGGDVGYGDAPTGEQIRASIAARRALAPGQSMITERGEHEGVAWERVLSRPAGTIGMAESYRLVYEGRQLDTLIKGRTPAEAAAQWREHVDEGLARQKAAEKSAEPPAAMTGTSYNVDALVANIGGRTDPQGNPIMARYRASATISSVTGIDSGAGAKYGPMVNLFNDLTRENADPADIARFHAENFSEQSVAGQADRAEAIAQVLDRTEHTDDDVRQWMPQHPAETARVAAGLHEYARAAREAIQGRGPASYLAESGVTERTLPTSPGDEPHPAWQAEMARQREARELAGASAVPDTEPEA